MIQKPILPRSIGFEGADATNKTRFSLLTVRMLEAYGQEVRLVGFPVDETVSGNWLKFHKQLGLAQETLPVLFAANRLEVIPSIRQWVGQSPNHWVVFDRTDRSGIAYGLAREGLTADRDWLEALDIYFPKVQVGVYLTRPLDESMEIIRRRPAGEVSETKLAMDMDIILQRRVREVFDDLMSKRSNWHEVDVSGLARTEDEFNAWEIRSGLKTWATICMQLERTEWLTGAEERVSNLREGLSDTVVPEKLEVSSAWFQELNRLKRSIESE